MKQKTNIFTIMKITFLLIFSSVTLYPFLYIISVSLSSKIYVLRNEVLLFPKGINFDMYKYVLTDSRIYLAYYNTIVYVLVGTVISLMVTSAGAYALSRRHMLCRKLFTKLMVICMLFHGGMIPTYLVVKSFGLLDTIWGVVLPGAVEIWYVFIMMSFFSALPVELDDAAKIDGVGDLGSFWYIALPLSKAAMATIGLFYAVGIWNNFMGPMIYLNDAKKFPLTVILREMIIAGADLSNKGEQNEQGFVVVDSIKYATIVVSVLPTICIYPFLQKYFVKGVMIGSIKG